MEWGNQYSSAVVLGIVLTVGPVLFFLIARLGRVVRGRLTGSGRQSRLNPKQVPNFEAPKQLNPTRISASELFVIRSNLNAVARQTEDLERRLLLEHSDRMKELASTRD